MLNTCIWNTAHLWW